jgi:hypothetical protein
MYPLISRQKNTAYAKRKVGVVLYAIKKTR